MLLMAGLLLADKTASVEDQVGEVRAQLAEREAELAKLRDTVVEPERIEVPVVPQAVTDGLAEMAARAESLAQEVEDKVAS